MTPPFAHMIDCIVDHFHETPTCCSEWCFCQLSETGDEVLATSKALAVITPAPIESLPPLEDWEIQE